MHESMYTCLGMEWGGVVWVWAHFPFGLALAYRLYTLLKQEMYRPLREKGVRMTFVIDGQVGVTTGNERARFQSDKWFFGLRPL